MGKKGKILQCQKCYTLNSEDSHFCNKCGSPLEDDHETLSYGSPEDVQPETTIYFKPGEVFDKRYRIIEEIGRGGMGLVYKAEDTDLNITVALKIIHPRHSSNPLFIERFKKETLTARSVSHENVIRIFDLGETDEIKYISMEYIKGQNLRDLIQATGALAAETVINLTRQMCEALNAAHQKGIIHQDLKPSNIMIDNNGQLYIMDFGLARSYYRKESGLFKGITGTPKYMAPEQAKGEDVDQRSDIYSLGVIMYEMLTGQPLFDAQSTTEYIQKHAEEKPLSPSKINPHVPDFLENVILKCLEKDKSKRYQDTGEILDELKKHTESQIGVFAKWIRRNWYVFVAPIFLFFIILSIYLWKKAPPLYPSKEKRISLVVMQLANNTGQKNLDYMGRTLSELLTADLLQSKYIRVLTSDRLYSVLNRLNLPAAAKYSSEDLKNVSSLASADYILQGSITKALEKFRINTFLHEANSMELIGTQVVEGYGQGSIFAMVDGLTRKIKEDFKFSAEVIAQDIDKDVMEITTNSTEAIEHYIEGKLLHSKGKFQESIQALMKAVSLDPEFALAYVKLSESYYYLGDTDQGDDYLAKALSLLNKVSEREYYLIQAYAAYTPQMAMENYQKLLELYPDDPEANGYLASRYRNMEEWDLAQERFERIVEVNPREELPYENLAFIYSAKGLYEKARTILISNQHVFTNLVSYHVRLGTAYLSEGIYDLALEEAHKARSQDPDDFEAIELSGHTYQIKGDFESAEQTYQELMNGKPLLIQYMGTLWLSHLYLMKGMYRWLDAEIPRALEQFQENRIEQGVFNFRLLNVYINLQKKKYLEAHEASSQALETANETGYTDYENVALHFRGLACAKLKRLKEARETAAKLKKQIEDSTRNKLMRHYHHLMGEIAREEGNIQRAIDYFETAVSLLPKQHFKTDVHILYLDSLASAYYESGNLKKAQETYERIAALTTGRLRWGDKYSLSFYHLGKIYQAQDEKEKALQKYERFLELWESADPELQEISNARKQLSLLKTTT